MRRPTVIPDHALLGAQAMGISSRQASWCEARHGRCGSRDRCNSPSDVDRWHDLSMDEQRESSGLGCSLHAKPGCCWAGAVKVLPGKQDGHYVSSYPTSSPFV